VPLLDQVANLPSNAHLPLDGSTGSWLRSVHDLQQRLRLAALLLEAALFRQESRGGHYRLDAPAAQPFWRCHTLQQRGQRIHTEAVGASRTEI
jgi:L-aspartate oxidase